jgi:hypothetical protein
MKKCDLLVVLMGDFSKVVFSFLTIGMFFYSTLLNAQSGKNVPNTPPSKSSTLEITSPTTGEKLEVSLRDLNISPSVSDVRALVVHLGSGWRLPTFAELELMYNELHLKGIGNFSKKFYTTLDCYEGECWTLDFEEGKYAVSDKLYRGATVFFRIRVVRPKIVKN